ncbi:imidazolonepropionase [Neisseria sp. Ec49-e6-T10]|uniref:imidazolonepropionase n=1 Tax=Neisseria sp. Ec49-e6-T10 TaxID=3140744 RepID=UPI003EBD74AA
MSKSFKLQDTDTVWINGVLATMDKDVDEQYGLLKDHCIVTRSDKIAAILPKDQLNTTLYSHVIDLEGAIVTPGLIDCHTHLVFGGNRAQEWEKRLNGISYTEIAKEGGGINSTVSATRTADFGSLYQVSYKRLRALADEGVTTVEIKSGYGLDLANERKQLEVVRALKNTCEVDISPTLLSAHSVPPEYKDHSDEYLDEICQTILPTLWQEQLFESVDVFCENIAFSLAQTKKLFKTAQSLGIPVKAHAEQLSNLGCSALVAQFNGLSVDHIEHLDESSIAALSEKRTIATLLPCAFYFLKETKVPPIDLLRQYKVPMAVSTDFNPGTSPFASIRLAMNMACTQFGLTPVEALAGVTRNAAQALGREHTHGQLKAGYQANFAVWDVQAPVEIFYELGRNPLIRRVFNGKVSCLMK